MKPPTKPQFTRYVKEKYTWRAMDRALYSLARMQLQPTRDIPIGDVVWSSVTTIGLTLRATIGRNWALDPIAEMLAEWSLKDHDQWTLEQLRTVPRDPYPSREGFLRSIACHGRICAEVEAGLKNGHGEPFTPRCLVSKWLHFTRPGVPIYAKRSSDMLESLDLPIKEPRFSEVLNRRGNGQVDKKYAAFCDRLWAFSEYLAGNASVRELDVYLYSEGGS